MHGNVKMASQSKISNKCAIKWPKMANKSHGASNTSSMIRNIHAQERCHLEGVPLCILHNAEAQANAV
jgi:predicted lipoprotein with Yx(FWY)xxD motif